MKIFFSILLALSSLFTSQLVQAKTVNYFVIAKQAMPFQIIEAQKHHSGIVSDIVQQLFTESEYQIDYHTYPFNRMISLLESGQEHNWLTYGSPNWGGVQAENLSQEAIYKVRHGLLTNAKSNFRFRKISDMQGKIFVLLDGFDYPTLMPYIESGMIEELRVKDYASAFRILDKMPDDAVFVEMKSRIKYNLKMQSQPLDKYNLQDFSKVIASYPIYLALDPQMDAGMQDFINQRLSALKDTGQLKRIVRNYL